MDAIVTIKFRFNDVCNKEDLGTKTFRDIVEYLIREEGICGVIDSEHYEIIKVEEVDNHGRQRRKCLR